MKKLILGAILMVSSMAMADTIVFESKAEANVGEMVDITINNRTASGKIVYIQEDGTKSVVIPETGFLFGAGNNITELENNGVHTLEASYENNERESSENFVVRRGTTSLRDELNPTRSVVKEAESNS